MYTERGAPVKERLLAATITCLRRKGFEATTARDIAAEAHANLRSIGYHYGSTRALLLAAISANWRSWLAPLISAAADTELEPSERLRVGMELFVTELQENAAIVRAWLEAVAIAHRDDQLRQVLSANQLEFSAALAQTLAQAGENDPHVRAAAIISVCDGAIVRYLLHGCTPAPREIAEAAAAGLANC
ncbi:MAG TPA: TetR/AcrR family transcriptional regulator [Solirubrobacteraceae bacterium]|jgi:AcrR family transcriptional regulator